MTIETDSDLFKALLAMDSYNRGYNAGIILSGTAIGEASILQTNINGQAVNFDSAALLNDDGTRKDMPSGFYAIAYKLPDESVTISYRGTDQLDKSDGIGGEILNAYPVALGQVNSAPEASLAFQFYNAVAKTLSGYTNAYNANITLTGNSSGGLAGLVADVYGASGAIFNFMPFSSASTDIYAF